MDLTELGWSSSELAALYGFIAAAKLAYQPFQFTERHAVGEGLAFLQGNSADNVKAVIDWPEVPERYANLRVSDADRQHYREANAELGRIYDHFVQFIRDGLGPDISSLDFAEFGCNTGYFLYRLSQYDARQAVGLDFTYNRKVFEFFNKKLGTSAEFRFAEWDSLKHRSRYSSVPMVDCCLSVAVLCHLADPLHHLSYLCSRSRKAVFVWTPTIDSDELLMGFGKPSHFANSMPWPISFDNLVRPSRGLLELCLRECGFGDITCIPHIKTRFDSLYIWSNHTGILAKRTGDASTIYTASKKHRRIPGDVLLPDPILGIARWAMRRFL